MENHTKLNLACCLVAIVACVTFYKHPYFVGKRKELGRETNTYQLYATLLLIGLLQTIAVCYAIAVFGAARGS